MTMNGAEVLAQVLAKHGVDTVFANPGTTEMHLVAALTQGNRATSHLCLFEGVATGAADGYARMTGRPAATLLHLGPGLANGLANLHNARKAATPVLNIVGEHALAHLEHDAPLTADIAGLAGPVSKVVETVRDTARIGPVVRDMLARMQQRPAGVGTLVVPNDVAWGAAEPCELPALQLADPVKPDAAAVEAAAEALARPGALLLLGSAHISARALRLAAAIAARTGARAMVEAANARVTRDATAPTLPRVPFQIDAALDALTDTSVAVLAGSRPPVAFFAYPERPSRLLPDSCAEVALIAPGGDLDAALEALAERVGAGDAPLSAPMMPDRVDGAITPASLAAVMAHAMPEGAILADESVSSGALMYPGCAAAAPHDWINNRGGSIGYAMPVAVGAAVACPDRPVIAVVGDGSASYTPQALWTMARAGLNVTVIILANRRYNILLNEMPRIGAGEVDAQSEPMITIDRPEMDWLSLARGWGVPGMVAEDAAALGRAIATAVAEPGPMLIEARM